jgi:hypothetical protein
MDQGPYALAPKSCDPAPLDLLIARLISLMFLLFVPQPSFIADYLGI